MADDIFNFSSPDLVNLRKFYKNAPKLFAVAAAKTTNTLAFQTRREQIKNIKARTISRNAKFVDRSIRVTKTRVGINLSRIMAEAGSIDISRAGRSSGFEELETGRPSKSNRVPTLGARKGQKTKKVSTPIRFNRLNRFYRPDNFAGPNARTKKQKTVAMIQALKRRRVAKRPFIIPHGLSGRLKGMTPGIWTMDGKTPRLMNPFQGKRTRQRRIAWNSRAADTVTSNRNLLKVWSGEIDFLLRRQS